MRSKFRFNTAILKNEAFLTALGTIGFVGAIGGGLYMAIANDIFGLNEQRRPYLGEFTTIAGDAGTYSLRGPDQVSTRQGDYTYTFNYEALQVLIDGQDELVPFNFNNFSNPGMIETIKAKGCVIAADFTAAADKFIANGETLEKHTLENLAQDRAIAQSYAAEHCAVGRQAPHVR